MDQILQERQQFTPDGQELPGWLSYQAITTTIDGVAIPTGTILKLPLTYYGPSIPLGPDWTYGGETSPASTSASETAGLPGSTAIGTSAIVSTTSPDTNSDASSTSSRTASESLSRSTSVSSPLSSPSAIPTISSTLSSSLPTSSLYPTASGGISSQVISLESTSSPIAGPTIPLNTPDTSIPPSDLRSTLYVLLPSILGPLLLALLVLLLLLCLIRQRRANDYARTAADDPSDPIPPSTQRKAPSQHHIPLTPPRPSKSAVLGTAAEKAPLLATATDESPRPLEKATQPVPEPEEEDITDFANPTSSSLLSRLSLGLGLAPTMRRISNGTAERAYRTPSWALAGLAALPRRISSGFRSSQPSITLIKPISTSETDLSPPETSRATSHMQSSGNGNDSSAEPPSAGYARTMGDDELFYQQPQGGTLSSRTGEGEKGSKSSRGSSSYSGSSTSRSTRGTGPSNWQSYFSALNEDGPPSYMNPNDGLDSGTVNQHIRGETVSVGIPETPKTGADSVRSSLLLSAGERRSRWVEEGDRMDFPVPPGGMPRNGDQRDSMLSIASGNSDYYSANSHVPSPPDTPPPYSHPPPSSTVRLVQAPSTSEDTVGDTLRPIRRVFARAPSNEGSSEGQRQSYAGEPLLVSNTGLAEFGQLRTVSGGRADTLLSGPNNSNARSSHYASVHLSESSPSMYSRSGTEHSGSTLSTRPGGEGHENLADSNMTFGAVRDRALRGRRSQATLVSATSIRRDQGRTRTRSSPAVPPRSSARPPPLPRLASEPERPLPEIPDERGKRKKSWFLFGR